MEHRGLQQARPASVLVDAKARLHLGFLDISGTLGRRFGSLGLSINAFSTRMHVRMATRTEAVGPGADRAAAYARRVLDHLHIREGADLRVDKSIPDHVGLGSGTQMALGVGHAVVALYGAEVSTREIAAVLRRGARSGIGIGAFDQGGFLVDSGIGEDGAVPPVTSRLPYPEDWPLLLVMDARGRGLHGKQEVEAFGRLPPFPCEVAAHLCHLTLMQILPGLRERQLGPVAQGIAELQQRVGDHFASVQGGRFTSPAVAEALAWAESEGYAGVGQSSWGPTGFVLLPDQEAAQRLAKAARRRFGDLSALRFFITTACNRGSCVQPEPALRTVRGLS